MISRKLIGLICVSVLCGILVAGLVPFQRPRNAVKWLKNQNGLHFGSYGTVLSSGKFQSVVVQEEPACSIEIWLQPGATIAASTILAFSTPENPLQFSVHQYRAALTLERQFQGKQHRAEMIGMEGVFRQIKPIFISITSGAQNTSMYVDGSLVESFAHFRIGTDCAGELVIGTSPAGHERWSGQLLGLAIYASDLTPTQVLQHYRTWTIQGRPEYAGNEAATAVYLLNEGAGNIIHNAVQPGIELYIPERYSLLHQKFLEPFWQEYRPGRAYWSDIALNIAGFIPLGFIFCAYWSSIRPIRHPTMATVLLGLAVSLSIEILQSYLPTRASGTTDLITNTLGTFLGVKLYTSTAARNLLVKVSGVQSAGKSSQQVSS